jgi:hypothetical protein
MPPLTAPLLGLAVLGVVLVGVGAAWMRAIGADPDRARRLAGARGMAVAEVLDLTEAPPRPVRVSGRIRCADPLVAPDDERLVAFHRDVSVRLADGRWRTIERVRETRSFELWDHAGSLALDPARAAEPLITIPLVWEGSPAELVEPHSAAVARLAAESGTMPDAARAVTRSISVVDPLLVLARVEIGPDGPHLVPPRDGYLVSALELDAAMRLLGGSRRRQLVLAIATLAAGSVLIAGALLAVLLAGVLGA